jgi:hypothetical protein
VYQYVVNGASLDVIIDGRALAHLLPASKDLFFAPDFPDATHVFILDAGRIRWVLPKRTPATPERAERIGLQ